jgi:hypothetical protein
LPVTSRKYCSAIYYDRMKLVHHRRCCCTCYTGSINTLPTIQSPFVTTAMNTFYKPENGLPSWTLLRVRLFEIDQRFRSAYCLHYQDFKHWPISTTLHSTTSQKTSNLNTPHK